MLEILRNLLQNLGIDKMQVNELMKTLDWILIKLNENKTKTKEIKKHKDLTALLKITVDEEKIKISVNIKEQAITTSIEASLENVKNVLFELYEEALSQLKEKTLSFATLPGWGKKLLDSLNLTEFLSEYKDVIETIIIESNNRFALALPWEMMSIDGDSILGTEYKIGRVNPENMESYYKNNTQKPYVATKKVRVGVIGSYISYITWSRHNGLKITSSNIDDLSIEDREKRFQKILENEMKFFKEEIFKNPLLREIVDIDVLEIFPNGIKIFKNGVKIVDSNLFEQNANEIRKNTNNIKEDDKEIIYENMFMDILSYVENFLNKNFDIIHISGEGIQLPDENNIPKVVFLTTLSKDPIFQLTPEKIASLREKFNKKTFLVFGNFCMGAFLDTAHEQLSVPEGTLMFSNSYVGPFFSIKATTATEFAKKFYELLLKKLSKIGFAEIGELLKETRIEMYKWFINRIKKFQEVSKLPIINNNSKVTLDISWAWVFLFGNPKLKLILNKNY